MDIDKFIDDNLDEILDNPAFFISTEQNKNKVVNIYEGEDLEEQDDIIDYHDVHEMLERKRAIINEENNNEKQNNEKQNNEKQNNEKQITTGTCCDEPEYYFKLINTFMKYYNDKYNKNENLFSNIEDKFKDTNSALELFFEAIMEFKDLKEKLNLDDPFRASTSVDDPFRASTSVDENDLLDKYYDSDSEEIVNLMNSYDQVYCLEIFEINKDNKKIITISLIICLNYVLINKIEKWNIFMLKSY